MFSKFRGNGGKQQVKGIAHFILNLEDTEVTVPLHFVELGQAVLILGMDVLRDHVSNLELSKRLLTFTNGSEVIPYGTVEHHSS